MREMGLAGVIRGWPVCTTIGDKAAMCALDPVNRQFHAPSPNRLWVSDFTYVATAAGFVYVAFVIDGFARYIVGWASLGRRMSALCWMRSIRRFKIAGRFIVGAWSTIVIADRSTCPSRTPSASPKPG